MHGRQRQEVMSEMADSDSRTRGCNAAYQDCENPYPFSPHFFSIAHELSKVLINQKKALYVTKDSIVVMMNEMKFQVEV